MFNTTMVLRQSYLGGKYRGYKLSATYSNTLSLAIDNAFHDSKKVVTTLLIALYSDWLHKTRLFLPPNPDPSSPLPATSSLLSLFSSLSPSLQFDTLHSKGSSRGGSRITRRYYHTDYYTRMMREAYQLWGDLEREGGKKLYTYVMCW